MSGINRRMLADDLVELLRECHNIPVDPEDVLVVLPDFLAALQNRLEAKQ